MRTPSPITRLLVALSLGSTFGCRSRAVASSTISPLPAVAYHRLGNGLRVVLARDATVPLARVGVYYAAGSHDEPLGRAGFAHLFEHYMFEGSEQLGPGEYFRLIVGNGGRFGARTLYDLTRYTSSVPSNALDLVLWAEADRMRGLRFSQDRLDAVRATVKAEVRQQELERPYGRFVWIDLPELAQTKWQHGHSIYGDSAGKTTNALDSASLSDVRAFFATYYTPDNAVLVVEGDIDPAATLAMVQARFGAIPRGPGRSRPDRTEPRQDSERRVSVVDRNATRPALAIGYHSPPRASKDFWPMLAITHLLFDGRDSWMYEGVTRKNLTDWVYGGVSARHGSIYTTNGPNFWTAYAFHDARVSTDSLLAAMDVVIDRLQRELVDDASLRRAIAKARTDYFAQWSQGFGEGKLDMLGQFALFDDAPQRVYTFDAELAAITAADVQRAAREYLRRGNRTVLLLLPEHVR